MLGSQAAKREMLRYSGGTTISNLSSTFFQRFVIPYVPNEIAQAQIAEILDTADAVLHGTVRTIAKLQAVKRGLLQDLLTRGVDDNFEMRDPHRHPEAFQQSELGPIPVSWTVVPLTRLLVNGRSAMRSGPFGSSLLKAELVEQGIPLLGIDNVEVERLVPTYTRFVSNAKFGELRATKSSPTTS